MMSEGDLMRWHEGYTERQARWLDMLAEGPKSRRHSWRGSGSSIAR